MTLTAANIQFFGAAVPTDDASGGGRRSATVVQNGLDNNLFPDVASDDRIRGLTRVRKIYPSLTNANTTPLLSAAAVLNNAPSDPNTDVMLWPYDGATVTRGQFMSVVEQWNGPPRDAQFYEAVVNPTTQSSIKFIPTTLTNPTIPPDLFVGQTVAFFVSGVRVAEAKILVQTFSIFSGPPTPDYRMVVQFDRFVPDIGACQVYVGAPLLSTGTRPYGVAAVPGVTANAATAVTVASLSGRLVPFVSGTYPTQYLGVNPGPFAGTNGRIQFLRVGDAVTLFHETATTAATATNGGTVNVGRTNLEQLAVVGADGREIARFLANGPTPVPTSGAITANLAAGTVTFTSVTGLSQPVTVRHRIAHRSTIASISGLVVTLANATTREFPAGSGLASHAPLGDIQARAVNVFAQQAWTRVFSDVLIGNPITSPYSAQIATTNQGAESDRFAIVFTSGNTFQCFSEARGLIASGNTANDFSPINPVTGAPFFTLAAASWAPSVLVGSALRFNIQAAAPALWVTRCTVPGASSGQTTAGVRLLGSTNA